MNVFIIAAISADGYIARHKQEFADWTSPADKKMFVQLTKQAGVMVMGSTTARTIGRALPGRRTIVYTTNPASIGIDGVETTSEPPQELVRRLSDEGVAEVAICGGSSVYSQFLVSGVVDELYVSVEPLLFGQGIKLYTAQHDITLELITSRRLDDDYDTVLLHYRVAYDS
jgi:dihydrofolate reductase